MFASFNPKNPLFSGQVAQLKRTEELLQKLASVDVEKLPVVNDIQRDVIRLSKKLFEELALCDLTSVSSTALGDANGQLQDFLNWVAQINGGSNHQSTALNSIISSWDKFCNAVVPVVIYSSRASVVDESLHKLNETYGELQYQQRALLEWKERIEAWYNSAMLQAERQQKEVGEALEKVDDMARQIGVSTFAKKFGNEADLQDAQAKVWLQRAVQFAVAVGVWAAFVAPLCLRYTPHQVFIAQAAGHGILVSMLTLAALFCARTFSACRHNAVVNTHRQNALSTFDIFKAASPSDPEVKKALLLQVMQAVFQPQHTGYLKPANEGHTASPVIEVIRNTIEASKP